MFVLAGGKAYAEYNEPFHKTYFELKRASKYKPLTFFAMC
jgi:hypothetical protein